MLFNSYIFILCFFPLCLSGYFLLNRFKKYSLSQLFLLGMSLWFYGYFNPSYLIIMLLSIVLNYGVACCMEGTKHQNLKKFQLILALAGNILLLFYFKYYDFCVSNINHAFGSNLPLLRVVLPLGISFFTFQQLSFIVDAYSGDVSVCMKGGAPNHYSLVQYASFVAYFPQLVAGPIVTHDELLPQFVDPEKKRFNWDNFAPGLYLFSLGLAKKVLIADLFGNAVNWGFGNIGDLDATNGILTVLAYYFQVYFDFSGYCDMAIGLGKMMNIDLPVNFDSPYKAATITEFWDRWHKTLTRFFTRYVYIPLGGNRRGKLCTYRNILIVYFVSGIWHGANWTFILWGALHGVFVVLTRMFDKQIKQFPRWLCWTVTFLFLNITWVFFRADSLETAFELIGRILTFDFGPVNDDILSVFNISEVVLPVIWLTNLNLTEVCPWAMTALAYTAMFCCILFADNAYTKMRKFNNTLLQALVTVVLLLWSIFSLSGVSTFLYFNF